MRAGYAVRMSTTFILIVVLLVLLIVGAVPAWPHSRGWGPWPSAVLTVILVLVLLRLLHMI